MADQPKKYGCGTLIGLIIVLVLLRGIFGDHKSAGNSDPHPSEDSRQLPDNNHDPEPIPEPVAAASEKPTPAKVQIFQVGDEFRVGYWTYAIKRATWSPVVGDNPYSMEHADAMFVMIYLTVTNNDRTPSTLPPMKLIDSEDREYETSSKDLFIRGSFGTLQKMNPDVPTRGSIMFDVPPDRQYALRLSGGFESKEFAAVEIPKSNL